MNTEAEAITIADELLNTFEKDTKKAIKKVSKMGFVNVDGVMHQYNPQEYNFRPVDIAEVVTKFNAVMVNSWGLINTERIMSMVMAEIPQLTTAEVTNYTSYITQSKVIINEELLNDQLKEVLNKNKELQQLKKDFKGKTDISSQLIVLRNNNIFSTKKGFLFRYKNDTFERYTINDVLGVLNEAIATEDDRITLPEVRNNWRLICDNLTDITYLRKEFDIKEKKANTLKRCKADFMKVIKVVKTFR